MLRPRPLFAAVVVLAVTALMFLCPGIVSAEGTHQGTFTTGPNSHIFIYRAIPSSPAAVMLTICQTAGTSQLQVSVDGVPVFNVVGCNTLSLAVMDRIQVTAASSATGRYTISLDLAAGIAPR